MRTLGEVDIKSISPLDRAWYNLVLVETQISLGNYDLDRAIQEAHEYFKEHNVLDGLARAKYLHGRVLIALGRFFEAKEQCFEAYLMFKKLSDYAWQGRALNLIALITLFLSTA